MSGPLIPPPINHRIPKTERATLVGNYLMQKYRFADAGEKALRVYEESTGLWSMTEARRVIERECGVLLRTCFSKSTVNGTEAYIASKSQVPVGTFLNPFVIHKIVMENGIYDLETFTFSPSFEPDEYHTIAIPVTYDPKAKCPNIEKFLDTASKNSTDKESIVQLIGYALYKSVIWEIYTCFWGPTRTGKSVLLGLIRRFLGTENCSAVEPQDLNTRVDKFAGASLAGKLVNIAADLPSHGIFSDFRSWAGGDTKEVQEKGRPRYRLKPFAKHFFSANEMPELRTATDADFRRWQIFDFARQFEPTDPDYVDRDVLLDSMSTPQELSGIFNRVVEGFKKMRSNKGAVPSHKSVPQKKQDYLIRSNPVYAFAKKWLMPDLSAPSIPKSNLHALHVVDCQRLGIPPLTRNRFTSKLKEVANQLSIPLGEMNEGGCRVWTGIRMGITLTDGEMIPYREEQPFDSNEELPDIPAHELGEDLPPSEPIKPD